MKASASKETIVTTIDPPAQEPRKSGAREIAEIIERVNLYNPEVPLPPREVSKLYNAAKNYAQLARAIGDCTPEEAANNFDTLLAGLQECVAAAKSGKFSLPPREMKHCAGVFAVKLFQEVRGMAEYLMEEGRIAPNETV